MNTWQQKGYDSWIELWVQYGSSPTAMMCPARWLKDGSSERSDFISGWNKAKKEMMS